MALSDFFASRLARPASRMLDAPIRDIVHELLREHGYASPAELQVLRDDLRAVQGKVDAVELRLADLTKMADEARATAAAARAELHEAGARITRAESAADAAAAQTAAAPAHAAELEQRLVSAPARAEEAEAQVDCKVPDCAGPVRSKGFCSAHYQQWRRGSLKGFVSADATALVDGQVVHLPSGTVGGAITSENGKLRVDGRSVTAL